MAKFFQKLKKQRSKNSAETELQSPPVTSNVGTQSEPLPVSFHLDGLLNSSGRVRESLGRQGSGGQEEVDGAMFSIRSSLGEGVWPASLGEDSPSEPLHLPPPLIPSPPLTLSRSPTPVLQGTSCSDGHHHLTASPSHSTPSPTFPPVSSAQNSLSSHTQSLPRRISAVGITSTPTTTPRDSCRETEEGDGEEMCRCQAALQALQERERRLVTEVADLRTEVQGSFGSQSATSTSPHPESVVAELEESLRRAEEAVQAVQGERDDLREGVDRMRDELLSLKRSNSLLARRKQQWMEVASQTRVVLEENGSLMSQYKTQQQVISDLRTQHHAKVAELEGELAQMEDTKKSLELQFKQVMEGQAFLFHQISRLLGVSVGGAGSLQSRESVQHLASLLESHGHRQRAELAAWQDRATGLGREKQVLAVKVQEAKEVTRRLEGELGDVRKVVQEGEESVARLRNQLEEVQEREEATQLQLAHAISQVDKAMTERDAYARIAKRWQAVQGSRGESETARALEEARHQLQVQAAEHKAQRRRYKTELHRLRALLAQDKCTQ